MAKDQKGARVPDDKSPYEGGGGSGGGINTGVAIIGFILCFVAGAVLTWGIDKHSQKSGSAEISAEEKSEGGEAKKHKGTIGGAGDYADQGTWSDEASPVAISSKDPMWGRRDAPVTVVVFSDFQCPYCSRVEPAMKQVKETYGPEKVRILWKNFPLGFHQNAKPAAEAAEGVFQLAGNEAFWKFHDTAFANQNQLNADSYEKWAKESGVGDMKAFKDGLASHKWAAKVDADQKGGEKSGVKGTPAAFINGVFLSGAQPFEKFKAVIDDELKKAQAKLASGTPKDRVYVAMSTENAKAQPKEEEEKKQPEEDTTTVYKVPVGSSPSLGPATADITIIEFSDFQCPYCGNVEPTLKGVRAKYGDKVRLVWKHEPLPFHKRAEPAAELALEAQHEKGVKGFWEAHDKLFENQKKGLEDADLLRMAGELGLQTDKVKAAIEQHTYKGTVDGDADLAEDFGASGTPNFFINGRHLVGARPQADFDKIIDEELPKAAALKAKGVKPEVLYETLIKDGKGVPEPEKKTVALNPKAPWRGNQNAKVVIQEFSDFECPFCQKAEDTVKDVLKQYGDKVKLVWRDMPLPFHKNAPGAAEAAREAMKQKGNNAFWEMHDRMFTMPPAPPAEPGKQPQNPQRDLSRAALDKYAQEMSLNMDQWKKDLDAEAFKADIDAEAKVGNDAGISGTPAFVINGYFISGAQPIGKFRKLIERALAEAK